MPHKSQIIEKKPLERVSRTPSRSSAAVLPNENPPSVAVPRKTKAAGEDKQAPVVTPKMADNLDRWKVEAADQVPAATSYKSTVYRLEFAQPRKIRRSLDASKEKSNSGGELSVESSMKAPKRSQTPLSVVEGTKKRRVAPPRQLSGTRNSLDAMPTVAVAASKPLPAEEAPKKPKQDKENAKKSPNSTVVRGNSVRFPLSQSNGQGPAPKEGGSSAADIEEPPFEILERCAKAMLGPTGNDKYFLDSLQHFYKRYRDCNAKIGKRLLDLDTSNSQRHWENEKLKDKLDAMTGQMKDLKGRLSQQTELKKVIGEKYICALKARTTAEKDFKSQLQMTKLVTDQQKAELVENQSQINGLKVELNNSLETNRGMASVLSDTQIKLKQTEETATQLTDQNNKLTAALQEQKLEMQNMVAEKGVFERQISQLESELKEKSLNCSELTRRIAEFQELQLLSDETAKQLELSRQEGISMKTLLAEKETVHISLNERIKELEATKISLNEINEEYAKELDAEKAKSSMELEHQKDAYDDTILKLNSTLNQQLLDFEKLSKSHEDLKEANRHQLAVHNGELYEFEIKTVKLEEVIKSLEGKLQVQTQNLQAEQRENQELKKEIDHLKVLTAELEGERKRYEAKIAALEAGLEERDNVSKAEQEMMQSLMAENEEVKKSLSNSKDEKEQIANELAAAKIEFEELQCHTDKLGSELFGLQEELKKKETKLIGVQHEKNSVISQLSQKMSFIGSVFEHPIITTTMPSSPEANKTSKRPRRNLQKELNVAADNLPSSNKRSSTVFQYASDFESEDDDVPVKLRFSKPRKMAVVKPETDALFDALKKST